MSWAQYSATKQALQVELLNLQSRLKAAGHRCRWLFEGSDAAGKGGTIKRFTGLFEQVTAGVCAARVQAAARVVIVERIICTGKLAA